MLQQKYEKVLKGQKAPGIFKKPYSEKKFQKKILKWIYIKEYREFLLTLFTKEPEGIYRLREELTVGELKKLRLIAKTLGKNRGSLQAGKLILAAVLVGLILGFNLLFKDTLLTKQAERWLEGVFGAQAKLSGLKFSPLQGRLSFESLTIADQEQPMVNLIELGTSEVFLYTPALLKGRMVINNLTCRSIRWQTQRATSGALAAAAGSKPVAKSAVADTQPHDGERAGSFPGFSLDSASWDIPGLIASQQDNSAALTQLAAGRNTLIQLKEKWSAVTGVYGQELEELAATVVAVKNVAVSGITTIGDARSLYTRIEQATGDTQQLEAKLKTTKGDFLKDLEQVKALQEKLSRAVESDYAMLRTFLNLPSGEQGAILATLAGEYLEPELGRFYTYGVKVLGYLARLKAQNKQTGVAQPDNQGMDVYFPTDTYPRFWLRQAAFSLGDEQATDYLVVEVQNISSNPELSAEPVSFAVGKVAGLKRLTLKGQLDPRQAAEHPFTLDFAATHFPLSLTGKLNFLGIRTLQSVYSFHTDLVLNKAGQLTGKMELILEDLVWDLTQASNIITREFTAILATTARLSVEAGYSVSSRQEVSVSAATNLDDLIAARIGELMDAKITEAGVMLEKAFDDFLAEKVADNRALTAVLMELETTLNGNLTDVAGYRAILTQKEKQLAALQKNLEAAATEELKKQSQKVTGEMDKTTGSLKNQLNKLNPF